MLCLAQGFSEGWFGVSLDARDHLYRCFGEADGGVALTAATLAPSAVIESTDFDARITQLPVYFNARDAGVVHAKLGPDALRSTAMAGFTRVQVTYVCPPPLPRTRPCPRVCVVRVPDDLRRRRLGV